MSKTEERRALKRKETAERRSLKRATSKKEPLTWVPSDKGHFIGKVRKGDAVTVEFFFSGLPVPYDEKDPDKGIVERTEALRDDIEKAEKSKPS